MLDKITELYFQVKKLSFLLKENLLYNLSNKKKIKILFSKAPVQEKNLRKGLRFTDVALDFNDFTVENIQKNDLIIPLTIPDLKYLHEVDGAITKNKIPIPSLESINICDDKYVFYQTLKKKGYEFLLPKIDSPLQLSYPYILKKKIGERGDDNYIISDTATEAKYKDLIESPEFFCQEMVLGKKEYATHILFQEKKIIASLNVEYIFGNTVPIKGQDKVASRRIVPFPYQDIFTEILISIGFEGICCFNYKEKDGKPLIIEINPRFGASLSLYFIAFLRKLHQ